MQDIDDDEYERIEDDSPSVVRQVSSLSFVDWILAVLLAGGVYAGLLALALPGLHPDAWNDAAVAAGLRPPSALFPGLGRVIAAMFFSFGAKVGTGLVVFYGRVCAALTAGFAYLMFRVLVMELAQFRLRFAAKRHLVQRIAALCGALFFACSDPMWRSGQAFTSAGMLTLLVVVSVFLFVQFLLNGRFQLALASLFICGFLAAESPFGLLLLVVYWQCYLLAFKSGACNENSPLLDPGAGQTARWLLSSMWVLGFVCGVSLNCISFMKMGALQALDMTGGDIPLMYAVSWWQTLVGAASGIGWVIAMFICIVPSVLVFFILPRAVDEERLLPYHIGAMALFIGVLSYCQLSMLSPLWFWNWSDSFRINSPFLLQLLVLAASGSVVSVFTVFGVEACCRDHSRLQVRQFTHLGPGGRLALLVLCAVALAAGVVPGRRLSRTRQMLSIIDNFAHEVVDECGDACRIFTDGSFDPVLELIAAIQDKKLYAISVMAGGKPYDRNLRLRGDLDAEDKSALSSGAGAALRSWIRGKPERLKECAIQIGFDLWKREGKELPPCSGVLARPIGMTDAEAAKGVANAESLSKRIFGVYDLGALDKAAGHNVCELFRFMQWRIARIARMRAERADRAHDANTADDAMKLSQALDNCNASLQRVLEDLERARINSLHQVTPREGLQLALARGNFFLAEGYARTILKAIKDDPDAHFAMAMYYVKQSQWTRAEEHLKALAAKRPGEPAAWNNLAMVYLKMRRLDEAGIYVKKALELIPESAEVKETLKQIEEAKKAADAAAKSSAKEGK